MAASDSPVGVFMSAPVASVDSEAPLTEAQWLLRERRISSLAVVDGAGRPVGLVSRSDLLRVGSVRPQEEVAQLLILPEVPVSWAMTTALVTVAPSQPLREAARLMVERGVHRVLVVEEGRLVGILSTNDVGRAVVAAGLAAPASAYMSSPVRTIDALEPLSAALPRLAGDQVTGLVVVEDGRPAGVFGQLEALQAKDRAPDTAVGDVMGHSFLCLPADTPLGRVARSALDTRARRVLLIEDARIVGILTGIDLARAILGEGGGSGEGPG